MFYILYLYISSAKTLILLMFQERNYTARNRGFKKKVSWGILQEMVYCVAGNLYTVNPGRLRSEGFWLNMCRVQSTVKFGSVYAYHNRLLTRAR